jgi:Tfp pilus assembly protein PilO
MSMSKEEKQKIFLCVLFGIGIVYAYFEFGLGPQKRKQEYAQKEIVTLEPKIAEAKKQIASRDNLKARVPQAEARLAQINQMIPEGSALAWFPTLVGDFFKSSGNERVTTRLVSDVADPAVEGYRRVSWNIEIPKTDALQAASILAGFENQQPLVECLSVLIEAIHDDPQYQKVTLTLVNSVRK